jgi:hypothetical protein
VRPATIRALRRQYAAGELIDDFIETLLIMSYNRDSAKIDAYEECWKVA